MIKIAGGGDNHGLRLIAGSIEAVYRTPRNRLDGFSRTQYGTTKCATLEEHCGKVIVHHVTWVIIMHRDFFKNDAALCLDIVMTNERIIYYIANHIDCQW
ncbi:unannotated protein [freshwater metagenome]|uniref:Unannotated protein n=1 Tax=freshwater metagenome TaxID=449393 RepID=A0A6J7P4Q5_9ZZZZ